MNYPFLKDVLGSPWQIDVQTLNGLFPILKGMISGLNIDKGEEPQNHIPFTVVAAASGESDEIEDNPEVEEYSPKVINITPLRGVLTKHDQECGPRGTRTIANRLLKADAESNVIGHILIVESGGGQHVAVAEMTEAMMKCTKPIVAWIDGVAASAGYYIPCYSKEIIASRDLDIIGCIGTMLLWEGRSAKSTANEEGEISVRIYADGAEEKNADYEAAINEFNFNPVKESLLNPLNAKFKSDVKSKRPMVLDDQLRGKTYFAKDVVGTLIDAIGPFELAVERVKALSNYKSGPAKKGSSQVFINNKTMAKQFLSINQVLAIAELASTDEGVFLNEEQLQQIEDRISLNQQIVAERDTAVSERDSMTAQRDTALNALASAFDPFNAIDASIASAETPEAKVLAIRTLLASKPGAAAKQTLGADPANEDYVGFSAEERELVKNL